MKQNVHDQLAAEKPALADRLAQNADIASAVMGYLNLFIGIALEQGYPVDGVRIGELAGIGDDRFRAPVTFSRVSTSMPRLWGAQSDFFRYSQAKAAHFARALVSNPTFEPFFERMVEAVGQWAAQKGVRFQDVEIDYPIITRHHVLTFRLKRRPVLA